MKAMLMAKWATKTINTVYGWGSWVKPTLLIMSGVLVVGILTQLVVAVIKGK